MSQQEMLPAGSLSELASKGKKIVHGSERPIVLFYNGGDLVALDNRCPHMGFSLHRGECVDGVVTCPWHYARFDGKSGSTFDAFAGDSVAFDIEVRGDEVFVSALPRQRDLLGNAKRRLREGMETNNSLICAKAVLALRSLGMSAREIVQESALIGLGQRDGWGAGYTSFTALANLQPYLSSETSFIAMFQGVRRVAADISGSAPRRMRFPLDTNENPLPKLSHWFHHWSEARMRDAAERTLLTALEMGATPDQARSMIFDAATIRYYGDGGHVLDFSNKAFELLEWIGWEHAAEVLPNVTNALAGARGGEESDSWRHPADLLTLVESLTAELDTLFASGEGKHWNSEDCFIERVLGDDPADIAEAFRESIQSGATSAQLSKCVSFASAMRVMQFAASNEIGDWVAALHGFTYCHAVHEAAKNCSDPMITRGAIHGAMVVYLNRFLNTPKARMPRDLDSLPADPQILRDEFLDSLNQRSLVDLPARLIARYLDLNHPIEPLIDTFTLAVVREDFDFHTLQMVDGAVKEYFDWDCPAKRRVLLVGAARYVAAMSPTQRTQYQTAKIALRLHRGEKLFEEEAE